MCTDTIVDDLERDLTEIQHSMPGVLRVGPPTESATTQCVRCWREAPHPSSTTSPTLIPRICPTLRQIPTVSQSWCNPVGGDWFSSHSRVVPHSHNHFRGRDQCVRSHLLHCASARANYLVRVVEPASAREFCDIHDDRMWQCLEAILQTHCPWCWEASA